MKYFLAIPLPEEVKQKLHEINSHFKKFKGLRLVSPDNMHLTLLFLGNNKIDKKINFLKNIEFEPFNLETTNIHVFPNKNKINLVWAELKKSSNLINLQKKLSKIFEIKKEYIPHITLARVKKINEEEKEELKKIVEEVKKLNISFEVKNFKLYSSELTVLGPVHRVIEYFEAGKK